MFSLYVILSMLLSSLVIVEVPCKSEFVRYDPLVKLYLYRVQFKFMDAVKVIGTVYSDKKYRTPPTMVQTTPISTEFSKDVSKLQIVNIKAMATLVFLGMFCSFTTYENVLLFLHLGMLVSGILLIVNLAHYLYLRKNSQVYRYFVRNTYPDGMHEVDLGSFEYLLKCNPSKEEYPDTILIDRNYHNEFLFIPGPKENLQELLVLTIVTVGIIIGGLCLL